MEFGSLAERNKAAMPYHDFKHHMILVVEDDENDALLLERALRKNLITNPLHFVSNGEEAVAFLTGDQDSGCQGGTPRPGLIITDLKMPRLNGLEFLQWLRSREEFRRTPLLVLTSSTVESDVANAYGFGANSYMVKPKSLEELEKLGAIIRDYWDHCELPPG
ncbi:MAG: response regulator [Verrucomicrobiia bacterium]